MADPNLIHYDGLRALAERAAQYHENTGGGEDLEYETFGVCTPDLIALAQGYTAHAVEIAAAAGIVAAMRFQFLAGFDIGYQARLEVESKTLAKADISDIEGLEQD